MWRSWTNQAIAEADRALAQLHSNFTLRTTRWQHVNEGDAIVLCGRTYTAAFLSTPYHHLVNFEMMRDCYEQP